MRNVLFPVTIDAIKQGLARTIPTTGERIDPWPAFAWAGVDPAGNQANHQTGDSNITLLKSAGLHTKFRSSTIAEGLTLIRARLQPAAGPVRLLIHPRCTTLIESMEKYHFNPSQPNDESPEKDGPDHAIDALRYLVLHLDNPHTTTRSSYTAH